jgi:hypothetical protein
MKLRILLLRVSTRGSARIQNTPDCACPTSMFLATSHLHHSGTIVVLDDRLGIEV